MTITKDFTSVYAKARDMSFDSVEWLKTIEHLNLVAALIMSRFQFMCRRHLKGDRRKSTPDRGRVGNGDRWFSGW
jgi:hypothetical protein